ncbi:MAG: GTP-binding protein [Minwuia sp.]|nr:GTP-binding protein [Minwuia sp.]
MSTTDSSTAPLPVTVIGGYLGAGKTTLVNHLLRHAAGRRLAVLVNEFGDLPIDADLIEAEDDNLIAIAGGCVCCSYGNDLVLAMLDLTKMIPRPDHVLLEASGVALPGAIAATVGILPDYELAGVVVMADAETARQRAGDRYLGDTVRQQFAQADIIVLNRTDLVPPSEREAVRDWLISEYPAARQVSTERGQLPPEILLGFREAREAATGQPGPLHGDHHQLVSASAVPEGPVDAQAIADRLIAPDLGLLRAKGVVQDFRAGLMLVQIVGSRAEVTPAPPGSDVGMVCIASRDAAGDSELLASRLKQILAKFSLPVEAIQ